MYSNFRFVGIHIWNYILDHLDINVTLPKLKKNKTFKAHILADNFTYHILLPTLYVFLSVRKVSVFISSIYYSFLFLIFV